MNEVSSTYRKTKEMVYIALFTVLIVICSWIAIPTMVPFTLQTFAVFSAVGLLGGKRGTLSIILYILLGAVGIPVFANFSSGISVLFGPTGGYILGFLLSSLVYWLMTKYLGTKTLIVITAMVIGLILCYGFGTLWFINVYTRNTAPIGLMTALSWCVIPFIIPDLIKIGLATLITKRVAPYVNL